MNKRFREIIRKERQGQIVLAALLLGPFVLASLVLGISGGFAKPLIFLVIALVVSYKSFVYLKPKMAIVCPICKEGVLFGNYANCPPRTDYNVEHKCNKCGAFFINAILQSKT